MSNGLPEPQRWKDGRDQSDLTERTAGETLRSIPEHEPLSAVQLARIAARVRVAEPRRPHRLVFVMLALILGAATAASAAHLDILPAWMVGKGEKPIKSVAHDASKVRTTRKNRAAAAGQASASDSPAAPSVPQNPPSPAAAGDVLGSLAGDGSAAQPFGVPAARKKAPKLLPPKSADATAAPRPVTMEPPAPALAPEGAGLARSRETEVPVPLGPGPAVVAEPPASVTQYQAIASNPPRPENAPKLVELEAPRATAPAALAPGPAVRDGSEGKRGSGASKYLSETVRTLRVRHDAGATLALLDRHAVELERNGLAHEALILRVEALLNLGREREALRLLDRTPLTDVAASHSLLVTRGRLRAEANRCAESVGDFSLVLAESPQPDRQALFGRAICRKQLGDIAGARADLEHYRHAFSNDPRLGELERRLGAAP
jgi:hypothetical protein